VSMSIFCNCGCSSVTVSMYVCLIFCVCVLAVSVYVSLHVCLCVCSEVCCYVYRQVVLWMLSCDCACVSVSRCICVAVCVSLSVSAFVGDGPNLCSCNPCRLPCRPYLRLAFSATLPYLPSSYLIGPPLPLLCHCLTQAHDPLRPIASAGPHGNHMFVRSHHWRCHVFEVCTRM
jgi:hypothetical protein